MLIRVLLAVDPPAVRRRLARLIRAPGVEVAEISVKTPLWERLTREEADIVVLGTGDGELPAGLVASVRGLPDR